MIQQGAVKLSDRVYSPKARKAIRVTQALGVLVLLAIMVGFWVAPAYALRTLWFLCIPLAPMVLLAAPNFWVSVCPVSTLQVLPSRMFRREWKRISPKVSRSLQLGGWLAMFLGIPTRHLGLNVEAQVLFWAVAAVGAVALTVGWLYPGLSGWCVGACPVRPIEVVYGQFAQRHERPEKCTECDGCVAHCMRLKPTTGGGELLREPLVKWLCYGLPGFIAAYFVLDLAGICRTEHLYFVQGQSPPLTPALWLTVYGAAALGWAIAATICAVFEALGASSARILRGVAIASYSAYYLGVAPEIAEVWGFAPSWIPALLAAPLAVLAFVLWPRPTIATTRA